MKTKNNLTVKQKGIVAKYNITVETEYKLDEDIKNAYAFFISGVYYNQKKYASEYDAYIAGISKVLETSNNIS